MFLTYTGFPEMLEGRVKTLHPKIHGGLLADWDNAEHTAQATAHGITGIDMVICNLYPFEATVAKPDVTLPEAIENIDIGGSDDDPRRSEELPARCCPHRGESVLPNYRRFG